jgi:hypothetical protein
MNNSQYHNGLRTQLIYEPATIDPYITLRGIDCQWLYIHTLPAHTQYSCRGNSSCSQRLYAMFSSYSDQSADIYTTYCHGIQCTHELFGSNQWCYVVLG